MRRPQSPFLLSARSQHSARMSPLPLAKSHGSLLTKLTQCNPGVCILSCSVQAHVCALSASGKGPAAVLTHNTTRRKVVVRRERLLEGHPLLDEHLLLHDVTSSVCDAADVGLKGSAHAGGLQKCSICMYQLVASH